MRLPSSSGLMLWGFLASSTFVSGLTPWDTPTFRTPTRSSARVQPPSAALDIDPRATPAPRRLRIDGCKPNEREPIDDDQDDDEPALPPHEKLCLPCRSSAIDRKETKFNRRLLGAPIRAPPFTS